MVNHWKQTFSKFNNPRILLMLFLGFSGGLPFFLTGPTLTYWFKKEGIDLATIGYFAAVTIPYSLRFLWAPVVDHFGIPWLTQKMGRRRSWALVSHAGLILSLLCLSFCNPIDSTLLTAFFAFMVSLFSATQDIVLDAYRTEILNKDDYGPGASTYVFGYRIGLMVAGSGAIFASIYLGWNLTYRLMSILVLVGTFTVFKSPEPQTTVVSEHNNLKEKPHEVSPFVWIFKTLVRVITDFSHRPKWVAIVLFIMLYKLSDNLIGHMSNPFYISMGFSDGEIAIATNVFNLWAGVVGAVLAGILVSRYGLFRILIVCGILEALSNLVFILLAHSDHNIYMLFTTVAIESLTSGMAVAAFVAFLSTVCSVSYTATHYAMMTSLSSLGRTTFAMGSGWIAQKCGWVNFFVITALAGIPAMILLLYVGKRFLEQRTEHYTGK